jgi:hypothetical protein
VVCFELLSQRLSEETGKPGKQGKPKTSAQSHQDRDLNQGPPESEAGPRRSSIYYRLQKQLICDVCNRRIKANGILKFDYVIEFV